MSLYVSGLVKLYGSLYTGTSSISKKLDELPYLARSLIDFISELTSGICRTHTLCVRRDTKLAAPLFTTEGANAIFEYADIALSSPSLYIV